MNKEKAAPSNLEYLIKGGALPQGTTLDEAADKLTAPLNCVWCIAAEQCADRYGQVTGEYNGGECREVILAYLKQDHKEANANGNE